MNHPTGQIMKRLCCLLCLIPIILISGCNDEKTTKTDEIDTSLDNLSLLELWDTITDSTDIQKQGIEMMTYRLHINTDRQIDSLYFVFYGKTEKGVPQVYITHLGAGNRITIRAKKVVEVASAREPSSIFEELDKIGIESIDVEENGAAIHIDRESGSIGYSRDSHLLYLVDNGNLIPMDQVVFHSQEPWYTVRIYQLVQSDNPSTTATAPISEAGKVTQIWFLKEDLEKAETVIYVDDEG